ncbi:MAG: WG repeat-containing protein [Clostridia bacterium]|nr:WG repeat-containing protein [Clostridia bacterium]
MFEIKYAVVTENGKKKTLYDEIYKEHGYKMFKVRIGDKWGFIDDEGKIVTEVKYDEIKDFHSGYAVVRIGNKYGVISKKGKQVGKVKYDSVVPFFQENVTIVELGGKKGYITTKGKKIGKIEYDSANMFYGGYAEVSKGKKKGYIDKKGKFYSDRPDK